MLQGSCLGPILFTLYTSKFFEFAKTHLPEVHCYDDDSPKLKSALKKHGKLLVGYSFVDVE